MAFIALRRSRNTRSFYLVESYRDGQGHSRKRTLCYLGREEDGTDTLANALLHWERIEDACRRELRTALGDTEAGRTRPPEQSPATHCPAASACGGSRSLGGGTPRAAATARRRSRRPADAGLKRPSTGRRSNDCNVLRRPSTPRPPSVLSASSHSGSIPTRRRPRSVHPTQGGL